MMMMNTGRWPLPDTPIFMDYMATTPVDPQVADVMIRYLREDWGNPSSQHHFGEAPRAAVILARKQVADLIQASPEEIIFTSGGSESNALALFGGLKTLRETYPERDHIITSAVEHPAVLKALHSLDMDRYRVSVLEVDQYGQISVEKLQEAVEPGKTALVSIMVANNEVGTLQPLKDISKICRQHGIIFHSDGSQAVGKIPIDVDEIGVDMLSIAAHKFYGPKGVGALYCRSKFRPQSLIFGAAQEAGLRSGTENVSGIAGFGKAAVLAAADFRQSHHERLETLRDQFQERLLERFPDARVNGHPTQRLPMILSIGFPGFTGFDIMKSLSDQLAFSAGPACNKTGSLSVTLTAMKVPAEYSRGTIRLSVGRFSTPEQLERAFQLLCSVLDPEETDESYESYGTEEDEYDEEDDDDDDDGDDGDDLEEEEE